MYSATALYAAHADAVEPCTLPNSRAPLPLTDNGFVIVCCRFCVVSEFFSFGNRVHDVFGDLVLRHLPRGERRVCLAGLV
jgi:hypothetical protein